MEYRDEKNVGIGVKVTDKTVSFELNTELSLPDYLGEISRLLWVRPVVSAPSRFLSGGNAEFSGRVCYNALYAGADGKLYTAEAEDTYSFTVPTVAPRADMLGVTICPDVMVGRVAAPRKLSLRARIHARVCGYGERALETHLPPEAGEDVCRLFELTECGRVALGEGESAELYGELDVHGASVLTTRAEVFLPEVAVRSGAVECRGEVIVTVLCQLEDADGSAALPRATECRLPLQLEVPLEGVGSDWRARATATVEDIRVAENGGKVSLAVRVKPMVEATCTEPVAYVKDLFVPGCRTECHRGEESFFLPTVCTNKNFSISGSFPFGEIGMPEGAAVIDAAAEAEVKEKTTDGKSIWLTGEIHGHVLFGCEGEFGTADVTVPFRVQTEGCFEELQVSASVPVIGVRAERGNLRVDAELQLSLCGLCFGTVAPVADATCTPNEDRPDADLLLYYPTPGESLWEVARRYAVPPRDVAAQNGLDAEGMGEADSLSGVPFLMIPTAF